VGVSGTYAIVSSRDDSDWLEKPLDTQFSRPGEPTTVPPPRLPNNPMADYSVTKLKRTSFGVDARAGYRCHERVSAEIQVEWFDSMDGNSTVTLKVPTDPRGPVDFAKISVEPLAVTANAKGYLMTGRYQPFLLLGGGLLTIKTKVTDIATGASTTDHTTEFAMRFAGGIDVYATRNVAVTLDLDYLLPFGDLDDRDYMSIGLGLQYRF
jgi:opacity protein-like surface antigen